MAQLAAGVQLKVAHARRQQRPAPSGGLPAPHRDRGRRRLDSREARPEPTYRDLRRAAYIAELGKAETPSLVETVGDVLDDLIRELRARGETVTQEAAALFSKVDAIKAKHPKPA